MLSGRGPPHDRMHIVLSGRGPPHDRKHIVLSGGGPPHDRMHIVLPGTAGDPANLHLSQTLDFRFQKGGFVKVLLRLNFSSDFRLQISEGGFGLH